MPTYFGPKWGSMTKIGPEDPNRSPRSKKGFQQRYFTPDLQASKVPSQFSVWASTKAALSWSRKPLRNLCHKLRSSTQQGTKGWHCRHSSCGSPHGCSNCKTSLTVPELSPIQLTRHAILPRTRSPFSVELLHDGPFPQFQAYLLPHVPSCFMGSCSALPGLECLRRFISFRCRASFMMRRLLPIDLISAE